MARDAGVEPRKSRDEKKSPGKTFNEDFYYEDGAPGSMSKTTEQKCPFPGMKKISDLLIEYICTLLKNKRFMLDVMF